MTFNTEDKKKFEEIWIEENVHHKYGVQKKLSDEDYINYHIWEDINWSKMYQVHKSDTLVIRGENKRIIFHGGCLPCNHQIKYGINKCSGCMYFKADWRKPDLSKKL